MSPSPRPAWKQRATGLAVVALSVSFAARARAQDAVSPSASPASAADSPSSGTAPAPPAVLQNAKAEAKRAQPTPILANQEKPNRPAFQLYAEYDLPALGLGVVFAGARFIRTQSAFCAPLCNPGDLNVIDRTTAGYWSQPWSTASDLGLYSIAAGALTVLIVDEGAGDAINDAVVVAESALTATALSTVISLAAGRPRPYEYGTDAPLSERSSGNAGLSFVSSHASVSFAIATSMFMTTRRLNPSSPVPGVVLGVGGALASFVATSRVMSGQHFISDALGGALVGASVGVLVPAMHSSPLRIIPVVSGSERGLGIGGAF